MPNSDNNSIIRCDNDIPIIWTHLHTVDFSIRLQFLQLWMLGLEIVVGELRTVATEVEQFLLCGVEGASGHGVYTRAYNFSLSLDDTVTCKTFINHVS